MGDKRRPPCKLQRIYRWWWLHLGVFAATVFLLPTILLRSTNRLIDGLVPLPKIKQASLCPQPCLDVVIPYHEADRFIFVQNGGLFAAKRHLKDVRHIYVVSVSNKTFEHMLDDQVRWFNEAEIPFFHQRTEGQVSGWKYQQALKLWAVQHIPELCNNVLVLDADIVWIRDLQVIVLSFPDEDGICAATKFKYNVATPASGAWESDIYSNAYHSFIEYFTGLPKMNANTLTAINHWQVMQRDVLEALERSLTARTHLSIHNAILQYGQQNHYDMTEYEAYFSFISYFYPGRMQAVSLPYIIRQPKFCNYSDTATMKRYLDSDIAYFACHDKYDREDFYVNCNGKNCNRD